MTDTLVIRGQSYDVDLDEPIERDMYTLYETDIRQNYWDIQPGDVVIDVGAGWGEYGLTALVLGASKVYFIEPVKERCKRIAHQLEVINHIEKERFKIINKALVLNETAKEEEGVPWSSETSSSYYDNMDGGRIKNVISTDLNIDGDFERVDWIKIDVDGAEVHALTVLYDIIRKFKPNLLIEVHPFISPDLKGRCIEILRRAGVNDNCYSIKELGAYPMYPKEVESEHILFTRIRKD
jgi:FkbM family methyltransferase